MIYIFDLLEFQVLAAAKGLDTYYGFPPEKECGKDEIFFAVYQMTHDGILKKEPDGLLIQPPVSGYMDTICQSPDVLVVDRGGCCLPRQCIYRAVDGTYVCVEDSAVDTQRICISGMSREEFLQQLIDMNYIPAPHLKDDMGDYDFAEYWTKHTPEELIELLDKGHEAETDEFLEYEMIQSVFSKRDKCSGELKARMILIDYPLELCMVVQPEDGSVYRERYDCDCAMKILDTWWRYAG